MRSVCLAGRGFPIQSILNFKSMKCDWKLGIIEIPVIAHARNLSCWCTYMINVCEVIELRKKVENIEIDVTRSERVVKLIGPLITFLFTLIVQQYYNQSPSPHCGLSVSSPSPPPPLSLSLSLSLLFLILFPRRRRRRHHKHGSLI